MPQGRSFHLFVFTALWTCFLIGAFPTPAQAQLRTTVPNPRAFGLDIPPAVVLYNVTGNVQFRTDKGEEVVGRIHVAVGNHLVIEQPDGRLVTRTLAEVRKTDQPFVGMDRKALEKRLQEKFPGFRTKSSRHFVFVYNTSQEFADATTRVLETMLPGVTGHARRQKIEVHEPAVPLVVIMFATQREYQQFEELPENALAFYDPIENYVVMYEKPTEEPFKWDLYYRQAIATIAHEGAHQILHNIGVQQRLSRWPMWVSEGIAEYYAPTEFGKRMRWKGAGDINDVRMFELESYLKGRDASEADGAMIKETVGASRLTSAGYASAWALTHYLASKRSTDFNRFMKKVSELRPLEGALDLGADGQVASNQELFDEFFGKDHGALERDLVKHLKSQPYEHPLKEFAHFVAWVRVSLDNRTFGTANVFHTRDLAMRWQQTQLAKLDATQRETAQSNLQLFKNRAEAERFASQWLRANN